ncbi:MAG: hypothetical protein WC323_01220 [Patescibacteria group bacterium]|jgi:acyl-CoA-binding protein
MKKDYTKYLAAAVGVVATTALVAGATYAYQGDSDNDNNDKFRGSRFNVEQHEAMIEAIDNQDYAAWKELMGDNPITEKIIEENFGRFVEMHQLMKDGKFDEAKQIREELGLNMKMEKHKMRGAESDADRQAIMDAVANNDYAAWKELMAGRPMAEEVTEEDFAAIVEAHQLMREGKFEEARQIKEDLGIGFGHGRGMGRMQVAQ